MRVQAEVDKENEDLAQLASSLAALQQAEQALPPLLEELKQQCASLQEQLAAALKGRRVWTRRC